MLLHAHGMGMPDVVANCLGSAVSSRYMTCFNIVLIVCHMILNNPMQRLSVLGVGKESKNGTGSLNATEYVFSPT